MNNIVHHIIPSPLGAICAACSEIGLCYLEFEENSQRNTSFSDFAKRWNLNVCHSENKWLEQLVQELDNYFDSRLQKFKTPLHFLGSPFQISVWNKLLEIPFGKTWSYEYLASQMNQPLGIRAIAHANGTNPIALLVPCHRVIGKNGDLTGYAGGLWRKKWLLEHESSGKHQLELNW